MKTLNAIRKVLESGRYDEIAKIGIILHIIRCQLDEKEIDRVMAQCCPEEREIPEPPIPASIGHTLIEEAERELAESPEFQNALAEIAGEILKKGGVPDPPAEEPSRHADPEGKKLCEL